MLKGEIDTSLGNLCSQGYYWLDYENTVLKSLILLLCLYSLFLHQFLVYSIFTLPPDYANSRLVLTTGRCFIDSATGLFEFKVMEANNFLVAEK